MPKFIKILALTSILAWYSPASLKAQNSPPDLTEVYDWIALIDAGRYFQSWQYAGDYFKQNIEAAAWNQVLQATRGELGGVASRELVAFGRKSSIEGMPDGDYLLLKFRTLFAEEEQRHELLFLVEHRESLKVVGYYIQ